MPRKRSRGTGYLGTDKGLREIYPRFGLDNLSRSTSTATHNRRKPGLLSAGTPELVNNAVTDAKLASGSTNPERAVDGPHIKDGALTDRMVSGKWAKDSVPNIGDLNGNLDIGQTNGQLSGSRITGKVPKANIGGVDWQDVDGAPNIPTKRQVERWAEAAAKKAVKK
jgi:hypothetical protein